MASYCLLIGPPPTPSTISYHLVSLPVISPSMQPLSPIDEDPQTYSGNMQCQCTMTHYAQYVHISSYYNHQAPFLGKDKVKTF